MKDIVVYHYDAFSKQPNKGNPAGVVLNDITLTTDQMQEIARSVGFNETAFIVPSDCADLGIRFFTPGHEMNLCGHGTIGTLYCMKTRGLLENYNSLTIETKAGILPIEFTNEKNDIKIRMGQANPEFKQFTGSIPTLAKVLGIPEGELDLTLPIVFGSTGTWTLLVPIKRLETFWNMKPDNKSFPEILTQMPHSSIHPFCLETIHSKNNMHSRHFSSPYSGTIEDPVTGTASGVMGAYYSSFIKPDSQELDLVMEQGQEINRDGEVLVHIVKHNNITVEISGTAVFVKEMKISI
jgi:PhzF family phenazine biosynthesis protein